MRRLLPPLLLLLIILVSGCTAQTPAVVEEAPQVEVQIDENLFATVALESLHGNFFCIPEEPCGEVDFPFIRLWNSESFTEQGKILLVTQVSRDLYEVIPELYEEEIVYIFRDASNKTIDRIYVQEDKWSK